MAGAFAILVSAATPLAVQGVFYLLSVAPSEISRAAMLASQITELEITLLELRSHILEVTGNSRDRLKDILAEPFSPTEQQLLSIEMSKVALNGLLPKYDRLDLAFTLQRFQEATDVALSCIQAQQDQTLMRSELRRLAIAYDSAVASESELIRTIKFAQIESRQKLSAEVMAFRLVTLKSALAMCGVFAYVAAASSFIYFTWVQGAKSRWLADVYLLFATALIVAAWLFIRKSLGVAESVQDSFDKCVSNIGPR